MHNRINKYIPYGRQNVSRDDIALVKDVLKSDFITQGPRIKEFESALCKYTGAKYAVAVTSGTAALHIACLAAGIKKGDEAITSPITFVASANCILYSGGKPVFADIQEDTVNIDPEEIKKKITKKTKAVIPVHFAGHPCDIEEISRIARKHNLTVIEDAAHALGAKYKKSKIGSCKYSDMTIFSFHPVKHITTGEGGAVLTNKKEIYQRLLILRNHGITKEKRDFKNHNYSLMGPWHYEQHMLGFNYRITDFQSALGISQLKKLDSFLEKRKHAVCVYAKGLSGEQGIRVPIERSYVESSWHLYYVRFKNINKRKEIFKKLRKCGIGAQVHYMPVYLQPYYRENFGYAEGNCPRAEEYYKTTITLPLYSQITDSDIKYVVSILKAGI